MASLCYIPRHLPQMNQNLKITVNESMLLLTPSRGFSQLLVSKLKVLWFLRWSHGAQASLKFGM